MTPNPQPYPLLLLRGLGLALLASVVALGLAIASVGPAWLDYAGAVGVATSYAVLLAIRTGGQPLVFGAVVLVLGVASLFCPVPEARAGAAVITAATTAVLAVMLTVPSERVLLALREVLLALVVSAVGALAVVGFRPEVDADRFDYATLAIALGLGFALVFRLGAGWHGLGRRGLVVVIAGSLTLAICLVYAEMLRRYGSPGLIEGLFNGLTWVHDTFGAIPRPLQVLIGFPALLWGSHMRARRRQGWWVTVFGVAATASVAGLLVNPATGWLEAALILGYSLPLGLLLGFLAIRVDLMLTGPRGSRSRRAEEQAAIRPEPARLQPLL